MLRRIIRRIKTVILEVVNGFLIWMVGFTPSHHLRRFFYRLFGMKIGKGSTIHMAASVYNVSNITIGEDSIIGEWAVLDGRDKLTIGDHVDIATGVMIYNSQHDLSEEDFADPDKVVLEPVEIADYVFIGPRAIILPGVKIGKGAVVGAGAVVTKNVGEFKIVGGVPAKEIGERKNKNPNYKLGRAAWFR
ncbi:MAG: acetyltransferase [uncultured bacterium]|nr:MAG: acetyltransferase [uncultured bacterium]KKP95941.1 MAG: acetyltransferase (isoleucine patch superfamily) [Candidatus Levybacteria bacterium GW2011_GWA2_36_13]